MVIPGRWFHVAHSAPVHHGLVISQAWMPMTCQSLWRVWFCLISNCGFGAWSSAGHTDRRIAINKSNHIDRGEQKSKPERRKYFSFVSQDAVAMHLWLSTMHLTHSRPQNHYFPLFSVCVSCMNEKICQCELCLLIWKPLPTIPRGFLHSLQVEIVNVFALDWCFTDVCTANSFQG